MSKKVYRGAGVARWGAEDGRSPFVGPDGYWYQWDNTVKDFVNTGVKATGTDGKTGPIPYPSGSWDANKSYTRTTASAPYVEFMTKYYLLIKNGTTTGGPAPDSHPDWEEMSDFNAIYTRMLIAAFANIGGAIFTGNTSDVNPDIMGRIISQWGVKNNEDSSFYQEYTGEDGEWQPNLLFDLLRGKIVSNDAEIRGIVKAIAGEIGILIIEENGRVVLKDKETGEERFVFIESDIPTISDITSSTSYGQTINNDQIVMTSDATFPSTLNVSKNNSTITFYTHHIGLVIEGQKGSQVTVYTDLFRNGEFYVNLSTFNVAIVDGNYASDSSLINKNIQGCPSGQYSIKIRFKSSGNVSSHQFILAASSFRWSFTQSAFRGIIVGLNGFVAHAQNNHIHYTKETGLNIRGSVDAPGILLSGRVTGGGFTHHMYGPKKHSYLTTEKQGAGIYRVYHSIGHTNYSISLSTHGTATIGYTDVANDSFRVLTSNSNGILVDVQFDFQLVGDNYT